MPSIKLSIVFCCLLFSLSASTQNSSNDASSQTNFQKEPFGVFVSGLLGAHNHRYIDFKNHNQNGEDWLGVTGVGLENGWSASILFRNKIYLRADYFLAKTGMDYRGESIDVEGQWKSNGISFGVGGHEIFEDDIYVMLGINFGYVRNAWDFSLPNEAWTDQTYGDYFFGDEQLFTNEINAFYNRVFFTELNASAGQYYPIANSDFAFFIGFNTGLRVALEKNPWIDESTNRVVEELNPTRLAGAHIKLAVGLCLVN